MIIIKNLALTIFCVKFSRTDYITPCGEIILYLTNFIKVEGSLSFKVLYAIYKAIVDENKNRFKYKIRIELIEEIVERYDDLTEQDKKQFEPFKNKYNEIIKKPKRCDFILD